MKHWGWLVVVLGLVLSSGCRQSPVGGSTATGPNGAPPGNPIDDAYQLILQRSVLPVNPATVASAGVGGLRSALLEDGVTPPQVPTPQFTTDPTQDLTLLDETVQITENRYASKLDPQQADDAVIGAMAQSVNDCHTTYFNPTTFQQQVAWIQGQLQFGGIGASLRKSKDSDPLIIWRVFAGTPAQQSGLRDGDVIQAVNGRSLVGYSVQAAVDLIRGPVGQPVQLTILPAGQTAAKTVTIVRAEIQPPSVEYQLLPNGIGYVQLYGFPENVTGQFKQALDGLDRQGAKAWVIDLRDNGGGSLDAVTQVLSMFVPKNTLMFYLYDQAGKRTDYRADGSERAHLPPIVLLTNDGTGSGAEIFAGVLQELGVAKVVGTQTAGCVGTGQLFPLPGGAGLQVTVAKLLTGRGKVLNQVGVTPDIAVPMTVQDLEAARDPQLDRALQLIRTGR